MNLQHKSTRTLTYPKNLPISTPRPQRGQARCDACCESWARAGVLGADCETRCSLPWRHTCARTQKGLGCPAKCYPSGQVASASICALVVPEFGLGRCFYRQEDAVEVDCGLKPLNSQPSTLNPQPSTLNPNLNPASSHATHKKSRCGGALPSRPASHIDSLPYPRTSTYATWEADAPRRNQSTHGDHSKRQGNDPEARNHATSVHPRRKLLQG